jgi:hypothetical protein
MWIIIILVWNNVPPLKNGIIEVYIENFRTRHSSVGNCFAISSSAALELAAQDKNYQMDSNICYGAKGVRFCQRQGRTQKLTTFQRIFMSWKVVNFCVRPWRWQNGSLYVEWRAGDTADLAAAQMFASICKFLFWAANCIAEADITSKAMLLFVGIENITSIFWRKIPDDK